MDYCYTVNKQINKNVKIKLVVSFILFASCVLNAQPTTNPIKTHIISIRINGAPARPLGISYGQMLTDRFSMEMGIGSNSLGMGVEYYITNPRKYRLNLNTGLYGSLDYQGYPMFSLPLGISYLTKRNFNYNLSTGVTYSANELDIVFKKGISFNFGIAISKRFGQDVETMKRKQKTLLFDDIIIKTQILQDAIGLNPNIIIEKYLTNRFSIGTEFIWRRRTWASSGEEWNFGNYYRSQGFTIGLQTKFYFSSKETAPNAWYIAGLYRYNSALIKNFEMRTFKNEYSRTVDISKYGNEFGFLIGRQFFIYNNITSEINIGIGNYWQNYEEHFVSGNEEDLLSYQRYNDRLRVYFGFTLGYFITKMETD